jgi:hypothetical protein
METEKVLKFRNFAEVYDFVEHAAQKKVREILEKYERKNFV